MEQKFAVFIVTDTHFVCDSPDTRFDLALESLETYAIVYKSVLEKKQLGYNCVVLFLGDVFDRAIPGSVNNIQWQQRITALSYIAKLYSVVGNHEITYYKDNLFWYLVKDYDSGYIDKYKLVPKGLLPVMNIIDRLSIGDTVFTFNHYGASVTAPVEGARNIFLSHNPFLDTQFRQYMDGVYGDGQVTQYVDYMKIPEVLQRYDYLYFGHMHMVYGQATAVSGTSVNYLGSLLQPKHSEVKDNYLDRRIPIHLIEQDSHIVEDVKIRLKSRSEIVDELAVEHNKNKRILKKSRLQIVHNRVDLGQPLLDLLNTLDTTSLECAKLILKKEMSSTVLDARDTLRREGLL